MIFAVTPSHVPFTISKLWPCLQFLSYLNCLILRGNGIRSLCSALYPSLQTCWHYLQISIACPSPGSCDCVARTRLQELLSVFPSIFHLFYRKCYQKLKSRLRQYSLSLRLEGRVTTLGMSPHHCLGCKKCSLGAWIIIAFGKPLEFSCKNQLIKISYLGTINTRSFQTPITIVLTCWETAYCCFFYRASNVHSNLPFFLKQAFSLITLQLAQVYSLH